MKALYSYRWEPQTNPFGVVQSTYDYPVVSVLPQSVTRHHDLLDGIRSTVRLAETDLVCRQLYYQQQDRVIENLDWNGQIADVALLG